MQKSFKCEALCRYNAKTIQISSDFSVSNGLYQGNINFYDFQARKKKKKIMSVFPTLLQQTDIKVYPDGELGTLHFLFILQQ